MKDIMRYELGAPKIVDRSTFQIELDALRVREKAHTREGDAIAAARRRLPMVEVDGATPLVGERGALTLLDAFEGRRMLIAYYFMWHTGHPAPEQCEGCTWVTSQVHELSYMHSRDVTFAVFCQGPYEESARYRDFMGWEMPWYSAQDSLATLLVGRRVGWMHIVCYLRQGSKVFETYWTTIRGVEAMDNSYRLLDLTVYGRQETWEDSPTGWPQGDIMDTLRTNGRALSFSGSISIARLRWTNSSHCGRPRTRRSFPNLRTNRGSCASLWPPILMATSFVSSMISGATHKRTTHRAKSSSVYRFTRITGRPDAEDSLRLADDPPRNFTSYENAVLANRRRKKTGDPRSAPPSIFYGRLAHDSSDRTSVLHPGHPRHPCLLRS